MTLATSEQKRGGDQVVKAVENIASISGQNKETASQLVDITDNLNKQAEELNKVTNSFQMETNGKNGGAFKVRSFEEVEEAV